MDGATVVGIRYDYHEDDGKIVSSNIVMIVDLARTLEEITQNDEGRLGARKRSVFDWLRGIGDYGCAPV